MATLVFFVTVIILVVLFFQLIIKLLRGKPIARITKLLAIIVLSYSFLWSIFYYASNDKPVPFGTDVCFDDWCATVTGIERPTTLGTPDKLIKPHGQFIILHITMSNHARGIAQKPSEPRVHIVDQKGNSYPYSIETQQAYEKINGTLIPLDVRLELGQSLETMLVFDIPKKTVPVKAVIEEGPFITRFLFYEDRQVFLLK
jgi:hypothetical protein